MTKSYNALGSLNLTRESFFEAGMCPDCCGRLTSAPCPHSQTIEYQQWLAAQIVSEQEKSFSEWDASHPRKFVDYEYLSSLQDIQSIPHAVDQSDALAAWNARQEGTEPSPVISGGDVLYTHSTPSGIPDDEIPF